MEYQRIRIEFKNSIALLTLNHPQTLNAVSLQMIRELNRVLDEIVDSRNVDIPNVITHLVEDLHTATLAITDVDETLVAQLDAMHDTRKRAGCCRKVLLVRRLSAPLA